MHAEVFRENILIFAISILSNKVRCSDDSYVEMLTESRWGVKCFLISLP